MTNKTLQYIKEKTRYNICAKLLKIVRLSFLEGQLSMRQGQPYKSKEQIENEIKEVLGERVEVIAEGI